MINKIKKIFSSELTKGSLILIIGTFIFNILNYLFHFSMARMLGPTDYGVLASLFAIIYFFSIPTETIQTTIARYTAVFNARKETGKIKSLMRRSIKKAWIFGIVGILIFLIITPWIKDFLKLDSIFSLILLSLLILPAILSPVVRGVMQGIKKFTLFGINSCTEGLIKLGLAVLLVFLGFRVNGAIGAVIAASFIAFLAAFYFLKDIVDKKEEYFDGKEVYKYSLPVFIAIICITFMYSIDVILAKHFFSEHDAGLYAVASMLGKMIFFALNPIAKVMFPIVSERKEKKEEYKHILNKALIVVGIISTIITVLYYLFPQLIISVLFGQQYLETQGIIGYLGLAFAFMTLSYTLIFYNLSLRKNKVVWILPVFIVLEIVLLSLFNSSLAQFSVMFSVANFIILLFLIIFNKK